MIKKRKLWKAFAGTLAAMVSFVAVAQPISYCSLPSKTQKSDTQNAKNRSDSSDLREPERFFLCNIIF